ncbi:bifunctional diguanylate cyclase/phosphodiesterase [Pseudoalteromonas denitrificans]|nr:EAL domain-containing protein [Pseudoalteromonas denitrificans]
MSFYSTYQANNKSEVAQLNNKLLTAKQVFEAQFISRSYYLSAYAKTVARDHALKSLIEDDVKSLLSALDNHRKRIDANFAIAINTSGKIVGELVTFKNNNNENKPKVGIEQGKQFKHLDWLETETSEQLYPLSNNLYQLSLAPLKSGTRIIGWIGFGYVLNEDLANELAKITNVNVSFLLKNKINHNLSLLASSQSIDVFSNTLLSEILSNKNESYIASQFYLGTVDSDELIALVFKSKVDILKSVKADWGQFVLLFLLTLLFSLISAYVISASITRPVKSLITQVKSIAQGNYDKTVSIENSHELMQLANEFNHMKTSVVTREKMISHRAYHDPLTDLPNRNSLIKTLKYKQERATPFVVFQVNIRRIKEVNDTLGHKIGDKVIIEVANRLKLSQLQCELFHLGADEFILLSEDLSIENSLSVLSQNLEPLFEINNLSLHLQYAIGTALFPDHIDTDATDLLKKSDVAMQYAKKNKKLHQLYDRQFDFNTVERLHLINSLKTAIEQDQLVLFYQPKMSLNTMKISHVEALVRWKHPINGLIPPDAFISIAEQTGQMDSLTRWVTKEAITQYLIWQKKNINIKIAINISAENLKDKSYSDFVIALKNDNNIADHEITLEVTEDAVLSDPAQATEVLTYLKSHGFKLSIDDYGTGYSSLAQLKQLPVQELKIDKSFVQQLMQNKDDQIIVRSTIELAHNMGLSVVAEGIEDERTLLWLKEHNCELAQGYFISRPIEAHLFETWLKECPYALEKEGKWLSL